MGDELSPEAKAEILWRDFENRQKNPPAQMPSIDRLIIWLLILVNAAGMGPEALTTVLKALSK